jgi:hypothetical protein
MKLNLSVLQKVKNRVTPAEAGVHNNLKSLDSRLRGNDMFCQSIASLPVIPAKLVLDSDRGAGIQELTTNLSIVDKQK